MKALVKFLTKNRRNEWIKSRGFSIFVRVARHVAGGVVLTTFDIANIHLDNMKNSGQGRFDALLDEIVALLADPVLRGEITALYVENVHYERFENHLLGLGFKRTNSEVSVTPCFYRML